LRGSPQILPIRPASALTAGEAGLCRLGTYDGSGTFAAWLHRIATNICLDMLRARKARGDPAGYGPPARPGAALAPPEPELAYRDPALAVRCGLPGIIG